MLFPRWNRSIAGKARLRRQPSTCSSSRPKRKLSLVCALLWLSSIPMRFRNALRLPLRMAALPTWNGLKNRCSKQDLSASSARVEAGLMPRLDGAKPRPYTGKLNRSQRLIQIAENIVDVLDADRNANQSIGDADFAASLRANRCMRHGCGMRNQGFDSAQRLGQRAHHHIPVHFIGFGERSGFKGDHRTETGHLPFRQLVLRMIPQSRIKNLLHLLVSGQVIRDLAAIEVMLPHAHRESLNAAQNQKTLKRRHNRARSLLQKCKFFGLLCLGAYHRSTQAVAVPIEKLGSGMHNHVSAKFDWPLEVGRHKSIVDYDFRSMAVAQATDRAQVAQFHQRVRRRLQKNQLRVFLQRS